jgi:YaaC-like Protein
MRNAVPGVGELKRRNQTDPKEDWRSVRRDRSAPPGAAEVEEDRRLVFQSALAQAEELWDAAAVAGPASRPLPLFYCLSQAGRAVCAAWTMTENWRPGAHGLRRHVSEDVDPVARTWDYGTSVTDHELGIYSMVAEATRSSTFTSVASVAQIWSSLPAFPARRELDHPLCLTLERVDPPGGEVPRDFPWLPALTHGVFHFRGTSARTR